VRPSHQPDPPSAASLSRRLARRIRDRTGITRDVSEVGVLFETTTMIAFGGVIEFVLLLRPVRPGRDYRVRCSGAVVRVDETNDAYAGRRPAALYSL